jgi:cold shock CspA family protein
VKIEFGHVQQYDTERGFGFVSRTLRNDNPPYKNNVWCHIKNIKCDYPDLAKELDTGSSPIISFWYEIENNNGAKVKKVWLDQKDIPNTQIHNHKKSEDNQRLPKPFFVQENSVETNTIKKVAELPLQNSIGEIKEVYVGLPAHLADIVFWVAMKFQTNPLSHIPGGSDVVVEYHDGKVWGYNRIKKPSAYIKTFFPESVDYTDTHFNQLSESNQLRIAKQKIARVFARKYSESSYLTATFGEVWNSKTSNEMPWKSLEIFDINPRVNYIEMDERLRFTIQKK